MTPSLPAELYELICGHLLDDMKSLDTFSRASHQFHDVAQKHIFNTITVSPEMKVDRIKTLCRLLVSSPQISKLVQNFVLVDDDNKFIPGLRSDINEAHIFERALPNLTNLKTLCLEGRAVPVLNWPAMSSTSMTALSNNLHSSLVHLSLYRVGDVSLKLLDGFVALKELSLELVDFLRRDMDDFRNGKWISSPCECPAKLRSLRAVLSDPIFDFFSKWIADPACTLDISNLKYLLASTTLEYHDHRNVNRILQACRNTLETFCFGPSFPNNPDRCIGQVDLSGFPSLRILRLLIGTRPLSSWMALRGAEDTETHSYLRWTLALFKQLESSRVLSEISLKISLARHFHNGVLDLTDWMAVDEILTTCVPSLQRFRFIALKEEARYMPDVVGEVRDSFSQLDDKNILCFEVAASSSGFFSHKDSHFPRARFV